MLELRPRPGALPVIVNVPPLGPVVKFRRAVDPAAPEPAPSRFHTPLPDGAPTTVRPSIRMLWPVMIDPDFVIVPPEPADPVLKSSTALAEAGTAVRPTAIPA